MNGQIDLSGQAGNNLTNYSNDGRTITTSTANFTRDVQEQIVKRYFDPSAQSGVDYFRDKYSKQATNEQPAQQNNIPQGQIDVNEYNRLKEMERLLKANPTVFSPTIEPRTQVPNESPTPVVPAGGNDDVTKFLKDIGIEIPAEQQTPSANTTQQVPPAPVQPGQDVNQNEVQILNEFKREALLAGVDPNEAIQFVNGLSSSDMITLFKAYKEASTRRQEQPQQPTPVAPTQFPQYQPQQYGQPNIVEMPKATSAYPTGYIPQQTPKNIFS